MDADPLASASPWRRCRDEGYLVPRDTWLPADERDFASGAAALFVGCNRLRCSGCREEVRSALGFARAPSVEALRRSEAWSAMPERSGGDGRLYACSCSVRLAVCVMALEPDPRDDLAEVPPPWRCAGHRPFAGGETFAGVSWDGSLGSLAALAAQALAAPVSLHPRVDGLRGFHAHRLYAALPDADARDALSKAIAARVTEDSLRPAVALFFGLRLGAKGLDAVARYVAQRPEMFLGAASGWGPFSTLADCLANAFASALTVAPHAAGAEDLRAACDALASARTAP